MQFLDSNTPYFCSNGPVRAHFPILEMKTGLQKCVAGYRECLLLWTDMRESATNVDSSMRIV